MEGALPIAETDVQMKPAPLRSVGYKMAHVAGWLLTKTKLTLQPMRYFVNLVRFSDPNLPPPKIW